MINNVPKTDLLVRWCRLQTFSLALISVLAMSATGLAQDRSPLSLPAVFQGEVRGVFAVRGQDTLASSGADQRLTPASVQKLLVAAAALDAFGPDFRFRTEVYARPVEDEEFRTTGRVRSLVVVAGADPTWNEHHFPTDVLTPLKQIARQLRESGVREVESELVIDVSRVKGRRAPNDWPASDASLGYGAAPSALALRDNRSKVRIAPGAAVGMQAVIEAIDPIEWSNQSITVPAERDGRGSIEFDLDWDQSRAVLRGEYPISERAFTVEVATPDPDQRAADALSLTLGQAGIQLPAVLSMHLEPVDVTGLQRVALFESAPLSEVIQPLLADSNNFTAEMLLRTLGHHALGEGRLDLGADALSTFLEERVGLDPNAFLIDDGSGLSPFNLVTPQAVVTLLQWAWQQPWRDAYFEAMASERKGTVRDFWPRAPRLRAKTGTLRQTQCLAGVLLPEPSAGGGVVKEPIFFAWMVNHSTRQRRLIRREVMDTLWQWSRL